MKTDILQIHKNCLDFLLEWQIKHENFCFVPGKINNKNRLGQGMYFRGNENYMVLTFWDNADSKEFIYNINWNCDVEGISSIELSCRDEDQVLPFVIAVYVAKRNLKLIEKEREEQSINTIEEEVEEQNESK